jgi:hypothetical protein
MNFFISLMTVAICSSFSSAFASAPIKWMAPDFYVKNETPQSKTKVLEAQDGSCRARIRKIICLNESEDNGEPRPCLPGGDEYAAYFERLYDRYPSVLQDVFCSLKVIHIEQKFVGTAYAGVIQDETGSITGAEMGIRKSVLDQQLSLAAWATWKEQLSFGGKKDLYSPTEGLPFVTTNLEGMDSFLYFVFAHEFGHILDSTHNLNRYASDECSTDLSSSPSHECEMHPIAGVPSVGPQTLHGNQKMIFHISKDFVFIGVMEMHWSDL